MASRTPRTGNKDQSANQVRGDCDDNNFRRKRCAVLDVNDGKNR
jgi:hypothetical protein